jgi:GNAT superfamily N-acetyltransferase
MAGVHLVDVTPDRATDLFRLILELAEFEKLTTEVRTSPERLARDLAGPRPRCRAKLAYQDGEAIGYALFTEVYFSFTGPWTYLDDLYVTARKRGTGVGKALLRAVAEEALITGCEGLQWMVLDWNEQAQTFYKNAGAELARDWWVERVKGREALARFAAKLGERGAAE